MRTITLKSATFYGKELEGTFPLVEIINGDKECKRDVYVRIVRDGKVIGVQAYRSDMVIDGDIAATQSVQAAPIYASPADDMTDDEIAAVIAKRFRVMDKMVNGMVDGDVKALIISGAPGVGKSFEMERRMREALQHREISKFSHLKGKITPMGLYMQLYYHSEEGQVLAFDDIDSVFGDEDCLNFLKAALDTGTRHLNYPSASSFLSDNGIPDNFEFNGSIVFITNKNFDRVIEKGGTMAEHFKALISRSNYLDLKVHTNREILVRVKQIIAETSIIADQGLTKAQGVELINWLDENYKRMREVSIRSVLKLASYMKADGADWQDTADTMMLMG